MLVLPDVAERWSKVHGRVARDWLDGLPRTVDRWCAEWGLTVHGPLAGGSLSVVLAADRKDDACVLKLAAPWAQWSHAEAAALKIWAGDCAPRLLSAADDGSALLMERVLPGDRPPPLQPAQAATLLRTLALPPDSVPDVIPTLLEAVETRFERGRENRHDLVERRQLAGAREVALELAATPVSSVLLHGDFLRKNLLRRGQEEEIVAIDPTPAVGDPCYDVAQWVITERPLKDARWRCEQLSGAMDVDPQRVWTWCLALGAVEASLASEPRARETHELLRESRPSWS